MNHSDRGNDLSIIGQARLLPVTFLLLLFCGHLFGQASDPMQFRLNNQGNELQLIIDCGNIRLYVSDAGRLTLSFRGEGRLKYSEMLGPEYGKLTEAAGGQVGYYFDTQRSGKIARVGLLELDYYDPYLGDMKAGRLKSVGSLFLDYYTEMDGPGKMGRISGAGDIVIDYYYGGDHAGKVLRVGQVYLYYYPVLPGDVRSGRIARVEGKDPRVVLESFLY